MRAVGALGCAVLAGGILLASGCRFGFDDHERAGDAAAPDVAPDGTALSCTATQIAGYDLGTTGATDIAAAQLPGGYAIGVIFTSSTFWGVHLDASLTPNASTPFVTSPSGGGGVYSDGTLVWDGTNLDGALTLADGTCYLKTFQQDMLSFSSFTQRTGKVGEPSVAIAGGTTKINTWFHDTVVQYDALQVDGQPDGIDRIATSDTQTIVGTSAASSAAAVVVYELANGSCGIVAIAADLSSVTTTLGTCSHPYLAGSASDVVAIYEKGARIATRTIGVTASPSPTLASGAEVDLVAGSDPRIFTTATGRYFAWRDPDLRVSPLGSPGAVSIAGLPSGPPDAYEAAGPTLFATYGSALWAITCP